MFRIACRTTIFTQQSSMIVVASSAIAAIGLYGIYAYSYSMSSSPKTFGAGPAFKFLRLQSVETLNHDTKRLRFKLPNKNAVSGLVLTSALLTFSKPQGSIFPVIRPYTPVSDLNETGLIELVVKRYLVGKASNHLHSLTPGQSLLFLAAIKGYKWKLNEAPHITLIAGGAGITPMMQLIRGILQNLNESTKITLIHGVNSDADTIFYDEFRQFEKNFPGRFKVVYTVSNPIKDSPFPKGYITKELLPKVINDSGERVERFSFVDRRLWRLQF